MSGTLPLLDYKKSNVSDDMNVMQSSVIHCSDSSLEVCNLMALFEVDATATILSLLNYWLAIVYLELC